jgi:hypothetical protein
MLVLFMYMSVYNELKIARLEEDNRTLHELFKKTQINENILAKSWIENYLKVGPNSFQPGKELVRFGKFGSNIKPRYYPITKADDYGIEYSDFNFQNGTINESWSDLVREIKAGEFRIGLAMSGAPSS